MEPISSKDLAGRTDEGTKDEVVESVQSQLEFTDNSEQNQGYQRDTPQVSRADIEVGKNVKVDIPSACVDTPGDVNMEASISADDVVRAGGFGARDDISSFLPVASDFTDFEASLLDARDYEEPQEQISRPGLGWTESEK